ASADLVLVQAPVDDPLGGWAYVASVLLAGAQEDPSSDGDGRLAGRERLLRALRTALLDAHRGAKEGTPCVVYLPHADGPTVAARNALAERRLLAPLALARAGGISELELFLDHFRSALGDGRRSGIERLDGADPETPLYGLINGSDDHAPLDDRVEWGVWGVLSSAHDVDTRSLLKRSYGLFRGAETPDRELVERCIAAYGIQGDDGRWRIRDEDALVKRQLEQTLLAASLIDAGHRIGFKVQVGRELRRRPLGGGYAGRANVLSDLLSDQEKTTPLRRALRGPAEVLDAVDLAWYDRGKMVFLWQIDWTARLHRSLS